jgi:hypothetical protein
VLFFGDLPFNKVVIAVILSIVIFAVTSIALAVAERVYFKKHADGLDKTAERNKKIIRLIYMLILFMLGGSLANLLQFSTAYYHARERGMAPDPKTNQYTLSYNQMIYYNAHSVLESKVNTLDDMSGKIIIYVRYDCKDCVMLHDRLQAVADAHPDFLFLSSRTSTGRTVRDQYNIELTEVPQGVYIRKDGTSVVVPIMIDDKENQTVALDDKQIESLLNLREHDGLTV